MSSRHEVEREKRERLFTQVTRTIRVSREGTVARRVRREYEGRQRQGENARR